MSKLTDMQIAMQIAGLERRIAADLAMGATPGAVRRRMVKLEAYRAELAERVQSDELGTARGIVVGCAIGAAMWVVGALLVWRWV